MKLLFFNINSGVRALLLFDVLPTMPGLQSDGALRLVVPLDGSDSRGWHPLLIVLVFAESLAMNHHFQSKRLWPNRLWPKKTLAKPSLAKREIGQN